MNIKELQDQVVNAYNLEEDVKIKRATFWIDNTNVLIKFLGTIYREDSNENETLEEIVSHKDYDYVGVVEDNETSSNIQDIIRKYKLELDTKNSQPKPVIEVSDNSIIFKQNCSMEFNEAPFDYDSVYESITEIESTPVNDPSEITSFSVISPMIEPSRAEGLSPDLTVDYKVENPHEYWENCETIEDYAEMLAESNNDISKQDVLDRYTYSNHFHLSGSNAPVEVLNQIAEEVQNQYTCPQNLEDTVESIRFNPMDDIQANSNIAFSRDIV